MQFDAQIQMIVSTFKLSQTLDVDPQSGRATMRYEVKCEGGVRSSSFEQTQAVVSIREVSKLADKYLGSVQADGDRLQIQYVAPRDYFTALIDLFPHCKPEQGGYLSFNFLMNQEPQAQQNSAESLRMILLNAEYKMVKQLSDNPDLIQRG